MNNTLVGTLVGLLTAICWGAGDWLTPRSKNKLSFWQMNLVVNLMGAVFILIILVLSPPHLASGGLTIKIISSSAMMAVGYLLFVKALTLGEVGIVVPLSSIYPMVTLTLSIIFLHQVYRQLQVAAMTLVVLGAILLAYKKNRHSKPAREVHEASFLTLGAVLMWGIGFFIINPVIAQVQWQVITGFLYIICSVIAAVLMLVVYKGAVWLAVKQAVTNKTITGAAVLMTAGTLALYIGAGHINNVVIPLVLSSLSPLLSTALGAVFDNERLGLSKRAGAIMAVGGIVLLNVR